jgi:hypothetical protein
MRSSRDETAIDKFAIPFVMGIRAASLNEEQLAFYAPALV